MKPKVILTAALLCVSSLTSFAKPLMKLLLPLASLATLSVSSLRAVEITESGDQVSIANTAFSLSYDLKSGTWSATDLAARTTVFAKDRFAVDEIGWEKPAAVTREWKQSEVTDDFGTGRILTSDTTTDVAWSISWKK